MRRYLFLLVTLTALSVGGCSQMIDALQEWATHENR